MPRPPVTLDIQVEYITPKMAIEYLKANVHNRKMSDRLVMIYGNAMKNDEWKLNGEPIIFDKTGTLQSGQHRLEACIEADTPFWSVVVRNAVPENLYSLDSGRRRSFSDVLSLRGEKDTGNLSTAVTYVWRWTVGAMDRPSESATHTHLLKMLEATPEIRDCLPWGRKTHAVLGKGFTVGMMSALYWAFQQIDSSDADAFYELIISDGDGLSSDHPVFTLLKWARRSAVDQKNPTPMVCAALVVKCWNAFREHRSIRSLSFKGAESFPEAV